MIFCPSCAARIDATPLPGSNIVCPVCGTEFTSSPQELSGEDDQLTTDSQSKIVDETPSARRQTTEEILLDRLKNQPPQKKSLPRNTFAIVLAAIFVISYGVYRIAARPDVYAPGHEIDSSLIVQKKAFFQHTIDSLQGEIAKAPSNIDLHLALADAQYDAGAWDESVKEFQTYLAVKPQDADGRVDYGIALLQATGNLELALSEIDTALMFHPDHINALINGGILSAQSINATNHVEALARSKGHFEKAKSLAERTEPAMAARIDTLIHEIDQTGARMTAKPK